jgi:S1-C subfamily serine protease
MKQELRTFLAWAILLFSTASASGMMVDEINDQIDQTNYFVGTGCSGTLVSVEKKLILTNHHCIKDELKIVTVEVVNDEGIVEKVKRQVRIPLVVSQEVLDQRGKVVGTRQSRVEIRSLDKDLDLALLEIIGPIYSTRAAEFLPLEHSIRRGEKIYIVGNPEGLESTLVEGIVSFVRRELDGFKSATLKPWEGMQISGGLWGGNSGGAVYNADGYLIGVPAVGHVRATFLGWAVPIDEIRQFLSKVCLAEHFNQGADHKDCKK